MVIPMVRSTSAVSMLRYFQMNGEMIALSPQL